MTYLQNHLDTFGKIRHFLLQVKIMNCILPNKFKCLAKAFLPPQQWSKSAAKKWMRYSTLTQNESEQRNALSDKIHSIEFPSLLTCLLLSSSTTIIKKDQKLRKNNGVNNTRKKNLTFLTVLGLSKKKTREKGKKKSKKKNQNVTSYPLNTTLVLPPYEHACF